MPCPKILIPKKIKQRLEAAETKQEIEQTEGEGRLREQVQATKDYDPSQVEAAKAKGQRNKLA